MLILECIITILLFCKNLEDGSSVHTETGWEIETCVIFIHQNNNNGYVSIMRRVWQANLLSCVCSVKNNSNDEADGELVTVTTMMMTMEVKL